MLLYKYKKTKCLTKLLVKRHTTVSFSESGERHSVQWRHVLLPSSLQVLSGLDATRYCRPETHPVTDHDDDVFCVVLVHLFVQSQRLHQLSLALFLPVAGSLLIGVRRDMTNWSNWKRKINWLKSTICHLTWLKRFRVSFYVIDCF